MRKSKTFSLFTIVFLSVGVIFLGCSDEFVSPNNDSKLYDDLVFSDKIELVSNPTFGSTNTNFKFNIVLKDPSLNISNIKFDFNYDHEYDITLTSLDTVNTKFELFGYNTIIGSVKLEDNSVLSCSTIVWITEPILISSDGWVYFEPNIYNGQFISITHGPGHTAQFIDINSLVMDCYFCGYESDNFIEMHCSMPSFDGNKLLFGNGTNYRFCYYDLVKNDSTITDIPLNLPVYPIGQLTWSLDNKSIYYVSFDGNSQSNIVKSYNLESNQIENLYNNGKYICVIPDQEEKLAILEKINESESKLLIYNITLQTIENEYNNIPFYAPFRMLRDNDRVYFDGELAFYSLSRKKVYYMQFDELNLSEHMYGEADINMDGNKFVIGTWHENRALYLITLPDYF